MMDAMDKLKQDVRQICHLDTLEDHFRDASTLSVDELWVEKHFRSHKSLSCHPDLPAVWQRIRLDQVRRLPGYLHATLLILCPRELSRTVQETPCH